MKKILVLFALMVASLNIVLASSWVKIDDNTFIDKDSIRLYINDHGAIEYYKKVFWYKTTEKRDFYKDIEKDTKKKVSYSLAQNIIDYSNETMALKSIILYAEDGTSIISNTYKDFQLDWQSIIPGSNGELWSELVRKPRILKRIYKYQMTSLQASEN